MTFERYLQAMAVVALGAFVCTSAIGQVTTRFTVPGGAAVSSKVVPGGSVAVDVRVDAPATQTIGAAFRIVQAAPASPSSYFQVTARDFTNSIYNDTSSGTPDAQVLALPSALLSPANGDNLGRNTVGLVGAAAGINLFVEKFTLSVDPATPPGMYTIKPTPGGTSAVTDTAFNDYDMSTTAAFDVVVGQSLTVTESGTGFGTVTSDVGGISCPPTCSDIYPGTTVTLTATPGVGGSAFTGWSGGGCSGTGTCMVTVNAATTVNAQFLFADYSLNVLLAGTGAGKVTSAPFAINCPVTCTALFLPGTVVTLTPTPAAGSTFSGWSGGGCSGTGTCTVTIQAATSVTATFDPPHFDLYVTKSGGGLGTVTSSPAGINCGAACMASFPAATSVTLTATPQSSLYSFLGWTGSGCSGSGTCTIALNANATVNALFINVDPPITTITGGPTNPSNVANPTFTFVNGDAGVTFHCSLEGAPPTICSSPHTVTVGNGPHTFAVFATDPGGNVGNTAVYSWVAAGIGASAAAIPTLDSWLLLLLALLVGAAGTLMYRRM